MHTRDLEEEKGAGAQEVGNLVQVGSSEAALGSAGSGDVGGRRSANLGQGPLWLWDRPTVRALGHRSRPHGPQRADGSSSAPCTLPSLRDGPHRPPTPPPKKVPSNVSAVRPFILSLRNGQAASIARGLDVAYLSSLKTKQNKTSLF